MASLIMGLFQGGSRLVCYVSDFDRFADAYGQPTADLLTDSCLMLNLGEL